MWVTTPKSHENNTSTTTNRRVRDSRAIKPHGLIFVSKPPPTATKASDTSSSASSTYNNLLACTLESFRVISGHEHTDTIDEDGILNTISIDSVFYASAIPILTILSQPCLMRMWPQTNSSSDVPLFQCHGHNLLKHLAADDHENTVDSIVRHIRSGPSLKYVICWYWYTTEEDTVETPEHIPKNFITQ